jgi:hypothetical protein
VLAPTTWRLTSVTAASIVTCDARPFTAAGNFTPSVRSPRASRVSTPLAKTFASGAASSSHHAPVSPTYHSSSPGIASAQPPTGVARADQVIVARAIGAPNR